MSDIIAAIDDDGANQRLLQTGDGDSVPATVHSSTSVEALKEKKDNTARAEYIYLRRLNKKDDIEWTPANMLNTVSAILQRKDTYDADILLDEIEDLLDERIPSSCNKCESEAGFSCSRTVLIFTTLCGIFFFIAVRLLVIRDTNAASPTPPALKEVISPSTVSSTPPPWYYSVDFGVHFSVDLVGGLFGIVAGVLLLWHNRFRVEFPILRKVFCGHSRPCQYLRISVSYIILFIPPVAILVGVYFGEITASRSSSQ